MYLINKQKLCVGTTIQDDDVFCYNIATATSILWNLHLSIFVVPFPSVILKAPNAQVVGQTLSLECIITTVRGIASRIDILWSSDGVAIKQITGASISSSTSSSIQYKDFYNISLVTTAEEGKTYQCEGVINAIPNLTADSSVFLDVTGK